MKKFMSKQKNCFLTLISLIFICEIMLTINNKIIQSIGIILVPFVVVLIVLLIRNDNRKTNS